MAYYELEIFGGVIGGFFVAHYIKESLIKRGNRKSFRELYNNFDERFEKNPISTYLLAKDFKNSKELKEEDKIKAYNLEAILRRRLEEEMKFPKKREKILKAILELSF
ncbi:MAG: hypothetical protein KKF67_00390 [Nanoarchaeota archaeon]|nr:hypothetical protein [Nanoarchaeota archaeon]